jgi:hypothetical protein
MNDPTTESPSKRADAFTLVRWFAFIFANGRVYGLDHKITRQSVADATAALQAFQQRHGDLSFAVVDDDFQIEGVSLGTPIPSTIALARGLARLNAQDLSFQAGISAEEVQSFANLLFMKDEQLTQANGFANLLTTSGLTSIHTSGYSYQRVTEHEAVVDKSITPAAGLDASAALAIGNLLNNREAGPGDAVVLQQADLGNDAVLEELSRLAAPPDDADLLGPAELTTQTIERLQRISDSLLETPANRTQKGRKAIRKLIKNVETNVAERLQRLGSDIQAVEMLALRVKELVEELAVDGLVAQYMKLRSEITEKENKLRRHIQRAERRSDDPEGVKSRLKGIGIPADILENLSAGAFGEKSGGGAAGPGAAAGPGGGAAGAGRGAGPGGGGLAAAEPAVEQAEAPLPPESSLSGLLTQLRETSPGDGELPRLVENILAEMNKALQQTAVHAEAQMATLKRIIMIPAGRPDNADLSRRQLLILMAELGQELRQPLTVITGAIDMLLGRYFGPVAQEQAPILEMAAESSRHLDELIGRMVRIAGMPDSLSPDENILTRIK